MLKRITMIMTLLALALALAACGGNADNTALDLTPADNSLVAGQSVDLGSELTEADKAAAFYIPGYYVLTSGADYIDGIDYQFRLYGNNEGHYLWHFIMTNNSAFPKTVHYNNHVRRFTFRIDQNGVKRWTSNGYVSPMPAGDITLAPYSPLYQVVPWDGRDDHGRKIQGLVTAKCIHRPASGNHTMSGIAWLNGK
ncbi:hypothetical protein KDL30_12315 [bacterium]|nr:hypothetical protein [bacterium]